jgi:hypothetical protein
MKAERRPRARVATWVAALSLAAATVVVAKGREMAWGTVEFNRGILTVRLTQPIDLRTVLEAICVASASRCDVAASSAEVELPPLSLTGTWREVVRLLMEGAGHNYAASEPRGVQGGRLWVEARPPGSGSDQARMEAKDRTDTRDPTYSPQESTSPQTSADLDRRRSDADEDNPQADGSPSAGAGGIPAGRGSEGTGGRAPDPEQLRMTEQSLKMLYQGFTGPRPPQPMNGMVTLPFVGPDGNFVVVPATNQPITVLPWPGPDGRPITVTPTPGVQLQWPIPATPSSSSPPK